MSLEELPTGRENCPIPAVSVSDSQSNYLKVGREAVFAVHRVQTPASSTSLQRSSLCNCLHCSGGEFRNLTTARPWELRENWKLIQNVVMNSCFISDCFEALTQCEWMQQEGKTHGVRGMWHMLMNEWQIGFCNPQLGFNNVALNFSSYPDLCRIR